MKSFNKASQKTKEAPHGRCRNHEEHHLDLALTKLSKKLPFSHDYEPEKIPYTIDKTKIYTPDFRIVRSDGTIFYIEYKGYFRREDRDKILNVLNSHPNIDLRIIFRENHKTGKVERVSDWCEKHGITYAIKTIPPEWFKPHQLAQLKEEQYAKPN